MTEVHASSTEVKKLASALTRYEKEVKQVSKQVQAAIQSASWRDRKKDQFEARYRDFQKRVDGFMASEVRDMVRSLNDLARKLEDIERMRM